MSLGADLGHPGDGMGDSIRADVTAIVAELKRNPMGTLAKSRGAAVAILSRNRPVFCCAPTEGYEAMLDRLEYAELNVLSEARSELAEITVRLDEL